MTRPRPDAASRQRSFAGVVCALEASFELCRVIGPSDGVECLAVAWVERIAGECVIDENIQSAECGDDSGYHVAHLTVVGDIGLAGNHATGLPRNHS